MKVFVFSTGIETFTVFDLIGFMFVDKMLTKFVVLIYINNCPTRCNTMQSTY